MPKFTVTSPDGRKINIEAPNEQAAIRGAQRYVAQSQKNAADFAEKAGSVPMWLNEIAQGASFGTLDEIAAAKAGLQAKAENLTRRVLGKPMQYSSADVENAVKAKIRSEQARNRSEKPVSSTAFNIVGGLVNPASAVASKYVAGGKGLAELAKRGAIAGGAMGAAYGAGEGEGTRGRLEGAAIGGTTGAAVGGVAPVVTEGLSKVGRAVKTNQAARAADVRALQNEGIDLTYGQMFGGLAKKAEEAAATLSPAISRAQSRGNEQLQRASINRALSPIGETLSEATPAGREAIDEMINKVGGNIENAYANSAFIPDEQFGNELTQLGETFLTGAPDQTRSMAQNVVDSLLKGPSARQGEVSGSDLSRVMSLISQRGREAGRAGDMGLADFYSGLEDAIQSSMERQGTGDVAAIKAARQAYGLSLRPEQAANFLTGEAGVPTPAQFQNSVKRFAGGARNRNFARGNAAMQDLSEPAVSIMRQNMGSSGTAERGAVVATLGTLLATGNWAPIATAAATEGALTLAYSKPVLKLVNDIARARNPVASRNALIALQNAANTNSEAARALEQIIARATANQTARSMQGEQQNAQQMQ